MNDTITDSRLEEMMLGEVRCEASHLRVPACTVEVTHHYRVQCDGTSKLVCSAATAYAEHLMGNRFYICYGCSTPCADDWSVVPV